MPFIVKPKQLFIPPYIPWLGEYAGFGNAVCASAMKILAQTSGEVVVGGDGYGGIFMVDSATNVHALMTCWRSINARDVRVFDARGLQGNEMGNNTKLVTIISQYRRLLLDAMDLVN